MHQKHPPSCQGVVKTQRKQQQKNAYTLMGTISGHSPHPPTCVWVGWVFCLGLGVGVGHFIFTVILVCVVRIQ